MLGRQVTAALRRPLQARLRTTAAPQTPFALAIRTFTYAPRLLDTAGRPRKAVGEPSRPVKRAVKKAAKKPATPEQEARIAAKKAQIAEKKRIAREKKRKQDAAQRKKDREAAKTPEQVERKKARLLRADISELKKAALKPPFPAKANAYSVFLGEKGVALKSSFDTSTKTSLERLKSVMAEHAAKTSAAYKALSAGELEHYNHLARVKREASTAEFKRWVESHSVEEIKLANSARRALRKHKDFKLSKAVTRNIEDERLPKRGLTGYLAFSSSRQNSGDFNNIAIPDRAKLIAQEWKALDAEEKEKYNKLAKEDRERYTSEKSAVEA